MNKKAEAVQVGVLIVLFVAIIVGVVLLQSSAQNLNDAVNTVAVANQSTAAMVNNTAQYLTNYKSISGVVIYNATGGVVPASNYTITNNVVYNGQEAVQILPSFSSADYAYIWKVSGTAQPLGYIPEAGGRSIAGLVIVFGALAIAGIVLWKAWDGIKDFGF